MDERLDHLPDRRLNEPEALVVDPKLDMTHLLAADRRGVFRAGLERADPRSRARRHRPRRSGQDRQPQEDAMAKRAEALLARESLAPYPPRLTVAAGWLRLKSRSQCRAGTRSRAGLQKPARVLCRSTAFCQDFCAIPTEA